MYSIRTNYFICRKIDRPETMLRQIRYTQKDNYIFILNLYIKNPIYIHRIYNYFVLSSHNMKYDEIIYIIFSKEGLKE